jgi:hypothetical protein
MGLFINIFIEEGVFIMKKLTRIAVIVLLLVTVCYTGFASDFTFINNRLLGFFTNNNTATLLKLTPGIGRITYDIANTIGGVIFQGTAVPAGNAIGQPVTIRYDPAQPDGRRLSLTIGGKAVKTNLYDWEIIPIGRFVESGYTACMTLFDKARKEEVEEEKKLDEKFGNDIMWANFHPAFGNTLIGLNLFFADAMFVNPELIQFADKAFTFPVPGYHKTRLSIWDMNRTYRLLYSQMILQALSLQEENYNTYIYTDYGTEISYRVRNRQIVFTGIPNYLFMYKDENSETVTMANELNERIATIHKYVYRINPNIYRTAEKTAQWAAFFRMVQNEYPEVWQGFMEQIDGIEPVPKVETPRYWLGRTAEE